MPTIIPEVGRAGGFPALRWERWTNNYGHGPEPYGSDLLEPAGLSGEVRRHYDEDAGAYRGWDARYDREAGRALHLGAFLTQEMAEAALLALVEWDRADGRRGPDGALRLPEVG